MSKNGQKFVKNHQKVEKTAMKMGKLSENVAKKIEEEMLTSCKKIRKVKKQ